MPKKQTPDILNVTRDHLTANSRVLLDSGRIAIHDDCIMALQSDGSYVREDFADHMPVSDDIPETAAGDDTQSAE